MTATAAPPGSRLERSDGDRNLDGCRRCVVADPAAVDRLMPGLAERVHLLVEAA